MKSSLEIRNISAMIEDYEVLKNINLRIEAGKVYGIVGQNGSGKTTFAELLIGHKKPTSGDILIDGIKVDICGISQAFKYGIYMIHQTPNLLKDLTVFENIHLNIMGKSSFGVLLKRKKMIKKAKEIFDWMGIDIDIYAKISDLRYFEQQIVEFAKALICTPDVLILDEPTCSLLDNNTELYLKAIKKLNQQGTTIIFISHRIEIINKLAEKVFVFKDKGVKEVNKDVVTDDQLLEYLTGDKSQKTFPKLNVMKNEVLFELRDLSTVSKSISNVNLTVMRGEIIGVTGLYGSGKTSIGNSIFGLEETETGKMYLNGTEIPVGSASECHKAGIGYIHENILSSLVQSHSVQDNIVLGNYDKLTKHLNMTNEINEKAFKYIEQLNLKCIGNDQSVSSYSIGSQQKIIFAKWLLADSNLVIIDEPTKNIDIISKIDLYNIINAMIRRGKGVILMSSDLDELIGMCDQIYIMYEGSVIKKMNASTAKKREILYYAMGKKEHMIKQ
jgi:ABC-type sugar transport system ATPase subunit